MPNTVKEIGKSTRVLPAAGGMLKFTLAFRGEKFDCTLHAAQIREKHQYVRVLPIGNHTTDYGVFTYGSERKKITRKPRAGVSIRPHKGGRTKEAGGVVLSPFGLTTEEAKLIDTAFGVLLPGSRSDKLVEMCTFLLENNEAYEKWMESRLKS